MGVDYSSDFEYARHKLCDSIVRYNNEPVFVVAVNNDGATKIHDLLNGKYETVNLKDLDLTPVPLGYCNWDNPTYVTRLPSRSWRQGIRSQTIYSLGHMGNIKSVPFVNMITGIYPKLQECVELVELEEVSGLAFNRKFAIEKMVQGGIAFLYKQKRVGLLDIQKSLFPFIDPKYRYLHETVEEAIYEQQG